MAGCPKRDLYFCKARIRFVLKHGSYVCIVNGYFTSDAPASLDIVNAILNSTILSAKLQSHTIYTPNLMVYGCAAEGR
jgi:hypothetical protein